MKRLLIAAALLCITVVLCAGSLILLERHTDRLLTELETLTALGDSDTVARQNASVEFAAHLEQDTRLFLLFLPHEHVDAAAESAAVLVALIDKPAEFRAEAARCRYLLSELRKSERLTLENLL